MRLTVFGASGRIGRQLVAEALRDGHEVTAFARHPDTLRGLQSDRLRMVVSELSDVDAVERAIHGSQAAISVMGPSARTRGTQLSDGVRAIVAAMERHDVSRIVVLSTASVADPLDRFDLLYVCLVGMVRLVFSGAYDEAVRVGDVIRKSGVDWTLVRLGLLNNAGPGDVRVGHYGRGEVRLRVSRASVARYLLQLATSAEHVRESPAISN